MRSYAREGRITEAIPMLEDSRQSDRLGPKGRVLLAQLYVESGDEEQARAVLEETLAAESTPEAKNDLAFLLARMERSFAAARLIAAEIDAAALAKRRPVTVPLAREVLARLADGAEAP